MLVKILSRHTPSYKSLFEYILKEDKANGQPQVFLHGVRGSSIEEWVREYVENEALRKYPREGQIYVYHEILSLSANTDRNLISPEMIEDLGRKYIDLRGLEGMYVGAAHMDRDHVHWHFATHGLQYRTGIAHRMTTQELQDLKVNLQEYHSLKYPELESTCNHGAGKEYVTDKAWYSKHRDERAKAKELLQLQVQDAFGQSKTQKQFLDLLRELNLPHYERGEKIAGIMHGEEKFRFSRLNLDLEKLPQDRTEEEKALDEIQSIRDAMAEQSRTIETELIR